MEDLAKKIYRYWWPRVEDGDLHVEVRDGERQLPLPVHSDPQLVPYIRLYNILRHRDNKADLDLEKILEFKKQKYGRLMLCMHDATSISQEVEDEISGGVALLRDTRMVIKYFQRQRGNRTDVAGVFLADPSINSDLQITETPAHDDWSKSATRAQQEQREMAEKIYQLITRTYGDFVQQQLPKIESVEFALKDFRRDFGTLFTKSGLTGSGHKADLIEIRSHDMKVEPNGNALQLVGQASIHSKAREPFQAEIGVAAFLAESDMSNDGSALNLKAEIAGSTIEAQRASKTVELLPNVPVWVCFRTDEYDALSTASATFFARRVSSEI